MIIDCQKTEVIEVDFRPKDATDEDLDVRLRIKSRSFTGCQHDGQNIDETLRVVTCRDCGAQLDPIEVMIGWASQWSRYADSVKALREERRRLEETIEDLKRQRSNLRSAIRRAGK